MEVAMKYNHKHSSFGGGYKLVLFLLVLIFVLASFRNTTLPPWAFLPPVDQTNTYTVTFAMGNQESQPSDITLPSAMSVEEGSTIVEPTEPAAGEGWQFVGWSSDGNTYTAFDFTVPTTANTIIYAFFASTAEVTEDESLPEGTKASFDEATGGYVLLTGEDLIELLKIGMKHKMINKTKIKQEIT